MGALVQEKETYTDYILKKQSDYTWITVNNISICIIRWEDGVSVKLYPLNSEDEGCIAETRATWTDAETQQ